MYNIHILTERLLKRQKGQEDMPLTPATCSQCGAPLSFGIESNMLFCQYCDTAHIAEINTSETVSDTEKHLNKARKWEELGELSKVRDEYIAATESDPGCFEAWCWLLNNSIVKISHMRNDFWEQIFEVETYYKHAKKTSGGDNKEVENACKNIVETLEQTKTKYEEALATCRRTRSTMYCWSPDPTNPIYFDTIKDHIKLIEEKQQFFKELL